MKLISLIENKEAKIGVIGLGYVGLPLAVEFARAQFVVKGVDIDEQKIEALNRGRSYIGDVEDSEIEELRGNFFVSTDYQILSDCNALIICVPTPLRKTKEPDISYIIDTAHKIKHFISHAQEKLIILESTTYPGTTEEVLVPLFEQERFKVGKDFYLAFSPERIDPGNKIYKVSNIPKIVGGATGACAQIACSLYSKIIERVVVVSDSKAAEMVKLLENTFRIVNIAMINEFAQLCKRLGVNVWEVIDAAATKPFGFIPFYPGPGLGGHCIPVDPFYLLWKARIVGFELQFITLSEKINSQMPHYVFELIVEALNTQSRSVKGSKILILGVTYKPDVSDTRESPAFPLIDELLNKGAEVLFSDPYVDQFSLSGKEPIKSTELDEELLRGCDCTVILTNHSSVDYGFVVEHANLIVDARGATKGINKDKIFRV